VSPHLLFDDQNVALAFANGSLPDGPYALVSRGPVPAAVLSWRTFGAAYMAPLWLHGPLVEAPDANLAAGLLDALAQNRILTTPEGLLHYTYAVLNSPCFRQTYAEGLRYGFARIPFARDPEVFARLRQLGERLVTLHLLEHPEIWKHLPRMDGDDTAVLAAPKYSADTQTLHLADALTVMPVRQAAWAYQQGAYPVLRDGHSFLGSSHWKSKCSSR
jgi:predicted helicase